MRNMITHRKKLDIAIGLMTDKTFEQYRKKVERLESKVRIKRQIGIRIGEANAKAFRA